MTNRWYILALLFSVRVAMAFQFQAVAALSPFIMESFQIGIADIGLLIGLYFSPGIFLALPGGAIGRRFGEKHVVLVGLFLMSVGGLMVATGSSWEMQLAGRFLAGIGAIFLNVLMTKMVTDWFSGKEIATAMGIFVNSWPVGIALALLVLPALANTFGLNMAMLLVAVLTLCGFAGLATAYEPPSDLSASTIEAQPLSGPTLWLIIAAGAIWGLYNAAVGMVFGFGPTMLEQEGWTPAAAGSVTSIVLWLMAIAIPLGGIIADRSKKMDAVLMIGLVLFAIMLFVAPRTNATMLNFAVLGLVAGLPAGPIMSLPSRVLLPGNRAIGMGLFFTIYYVSMVLGPLVAGWLAEVSGRISIAFDLGIAMLIICTVFHLIFRWSTVRPKAPIHAPTSLVRSGATDDGSNGN